MQSPFTEPETAAAAAADDAAYYRRVLHELIEVGADLIRIVHRQATEQAGLAEAGAAEPGPAPDPSLAYDRVTRAVRRTIVLARTLAEPVRPAQQPAQPPAAPRIAARRRIIRDVEDAIQRSADSVAAEGLHAELHERLDTPDLDDDIDTRPVADIVADICRDLGIEASFGTRPWKRRTPGDVAELCARAARVRDRPCPPASPSPAPAWGRGERVFPLSPGARGSG